MVEVIEDEEDMGEWVFKDVKTEDDETSKMLNNLWIDYYKKHHENNPNRPRITLKLLQKQMIWFNIDPDWMVGKTSYRFKWNSNENHFFSFIDAGAVSHSWSKKADDVASVEDYAIDIAEGRPILFSVAYYMCNDLLYANYRINDSVKTVHIKTWDDIPRELVDEMFKIMEPDDRYKKAKYVHLLSPITLWGVFMNYRGGCL